MLQSSYSSKADIPEGLSEHYKEQSDGSFFLQVSGMKSKNDFNGVKKALSNQRDENESLKKELSKYPKDFDTEKWDSVKHVDLEDINGGGDEKFLKQIDGYKDQLSRLKDKLQEKEQVLEEKTNKYKSTLQRADVKSALASAGVTDPDYLDVTTDMAMRNQRIKSVEDDGTFKTIVGDLEQSPKEWANDWVDTETGRKFAAANENNGGGSRNNGKTVSKDNPFAKGNENLTEQGKLIRNEPQRAKQLAEQAGVELNGI